MSGRKTELSRKTNETNITLELDLDGSGQTDVTTGIGMLDHLLTSLARHARFDLSLTCRGDLQVDDHHTAEDCALALGAALNRALGERRGIMRFGWALAPLDESLAAAAVDLSGRPYARVVLGLERESIGTLSCENVGHVIQSLAMASRSCIHVELLAGENDHHRAESAFKAVALALRQAVAQDGGDQVPSTKGVL